MKTKTHGPGKSGFTLLEIMLVATIIGLVIAMVIPSVIRAQKTERKNACIETLRLIEIGKNSYAREYGISNGAILSAQDIRHLEMDKKKCPSGGTYTVNAIGADPTCSYSQLGHVLPKCAPPQKTP